LSFGEFNSTHFHPVFQISNLCGSKPLRICDNLDHHNSFFIIKINRHLWPFYLPQMFATQSYVAIFVYHQSVKNANCVTLFPIFCGSFRLSQTLFVCCFFFICCSSLSWYAGFSLWLLLISLLVPLFYYYFYL